METEGLTGFRKVVKDMVMVYTVKKQRLKSAKYKMLVGQSRGEIRVSFHVVPLGGFAWWGAGVGCVILLN